jgi:hypothetical protein
MTEDAKSLASMPEAPAASAAAAAAAADGPVEACTFGYETPG